MKKTVTAQFIVLLLGTIFAWSNFTYELINWLNKKSCTVGCATGAINPFLTPCFFGALFFTAAFVLIAILLKNNRQKISHGNI